MGEEAKKTFSREYKVAAVRRMLAGENVSALARELGVRRKYLYQWRERFRLGGAIALRSRGRPTRPRFWRCRRGGWGRGGGRRHVRRPSDAAGGAARRESR